MMTPAEIAEQVEFHRTKMVETAERLSETAMSGKCIACIVLLISPDGSSESHVVGMRFTEAIGTMKVASEAFTRRCIS